VNPMTNNDKDILILLFWGVVVTLFLTLYPNSHPTLTQTYYESHTVRQGETLSQIVEKYHGSLKSTLVEHPSPVVMPGEKLRVVIEGR